MKKILVVQPFGIGDVLFATPLIRALKKQYGAARVDVLLGSRTREVFDNNPYVDGIYMIDRDRLRKQGRLESLKEVLGLLWTLRKNRYDVMFDLSLAREYSFFSFFFLWIPERIGFNYKRRGIFHSKNTALPEGYREMHVCQYYSDLAGFLGVNVDDAKPDFFVRAAEDQWAERFLTEQGIPSGGRFAVVAPGGGESWGKDAYFKRWAPGYFAEAINQLPETGITHVIILGSAGEAGLGEEVLASTRKKGINLCGKISLRHSAAVLNRALFLLANDSGTVHLARALEVPTVALYGPVDQKNYGPYPPAAEYLAIGREDLECRPCYRRFRYNTACEDRACLTKLPPDELIRKVRSAGFLNVLQRRKPAPSASVFPLR